MIAFACSIHSSHMCSASSLSAFARLGSLLAIAIRLFPHSRWILPLFFFVQPQFCDICDCNFSFHFWFSLAARVSYRVQPGYAPGYVYVPRKYLFFTFVARWMVASGFGKINAVIFCYSWRTGKQRKNTWQRSHDEFQMCAIISQTDSQTNTHTQQINDTHHIHSAEHSMHSSDSLFGCFCYW